MQINKPGLEHTNNKPQGKVQAADLALVKSESTFDAPVIEKVQYVQDNDVYNYPDCHEGELNEGIDKSNNSISIQKEFRETKPRMMQAPNSLKTAQTSNLSK